MKNFPPIRIVSDREMEERIIEDLKKAGADLSEFSNYFTTPYGRMKAGLKIPPQNKIIAAISYIRKTIQVFGLHVLTILLSLLTRIALSALTVNGGKIHVTIKASIFFLLERVAGGIYHFLNPKHLKPLSMRLYSKVNKLGMLWFRRGMCFLAWGDKMMKQKSARALFLFNSNNNCTKSEAHWLSPKGDLIGTHGSHTSTVIEMPEIFGLSREDAESLFIKGEELAVLTHLIEQGWIRIRFHNNNYLVSANTLSSECRNNIIRWASGVLDEQPDRENTAVIIEELSGSFIRVVSIKNASLGDFSNDISLDIDPLSDQFFMEWSLVYSRFR